MDGVSAERKARPDLLVPAEAASLARIRNWLDGKLASEGVPDHFRSDLALAITELCSNIIRHGYKGEAGMIGLSASFSDGSVRVVITDDAPVFTPVNHKQSRPRESMREGGYGIPLISALADQITHEAMGKRGNQGGDGQTWDDEIGIRTVDRHRLCPLIAGDLVKTAQRC